MQKRQSLAIGLFILGALSLGILGIILFSVGNIFQPNIIYTMSFDKSVKGLAKGAPVMFRGILIGEVTDIKLSFDQPSMPPTPPGTPHHGTWPISVSVKLYPNSIAFAENRHGSWLDKITGPILHYQDRSALEVWLEEMILEHGLRAQLQSQNFLTGLLYIELDLFHEETADRSIRDQVANHVIPTRISAFERLYLSLNQNDFTGQINQLYTVANVIGKFFSEGKAENMLNHLVSVSNNLDGTLKNINALCERINSPQGNEVFNNTAQLVASLNDSAKNLEAILKKLNSQRTDDILNQTHKALKGVNATISDIRSYIAPNKPIGRLMPFAAAAITQILTATSNTINNLNKTAAILPDTVNDAKQLIQKSSAAMDHITESLPQLLGRLQTSLQQIEQAASATEKLLGNANDTIVGRDTEVMQNLTRTLEDARQAAQAIRKLAELLEQQPEALLRGKQ